MLRLAEILLEARPAPSWAQLRQIGVEEAVGVLPRATTDWRGHAPEAPWAYGPLALLRQEIEDAGLRLTVIEDNPPMDRLRLGLPGREEELEHILELLRTMGRLGIEVLCYNWMAVVPWSRTSSAIPTRGGAQATGFDLATWSTAPDAPSAPVEEERLWESLAWFLERAVPVAEEAGVRLALHPDDPPLSPLRGIGRIIRSLDAYDRVFDLQPSVANGMTMCQGNVALMTDDLPVCNSQVRLAGTDSLRPLPRRPRNSRAIRRDVRRRRPDRHGRLHPRVSRLRGGRAAPHRPFTRAHGRQLDRRRIPDARRLHAVGYVQGLLAGAEGAQQQA